MSPIGLRLAVLLAVVALTLAGAFDIDLEQTRG